MFGGFVQLKTKAAGSTSANPFSPTTTGSVTQPASTSLNGVNPPTKIDYTGLSPINPGANVFFSSDGDSFDVNSPAECLTPNEPIRTQDTPVKKSAFGFIKKSGIVQSQAENKAADQRDPFSFLSNLSQSQHDNNSPDRANPSTQNDNVEVKDFTNSNMIEDLLSLGTDEPTKPAPQFPLQTYSTDSRNDQHSATEQLTDLLDFGNSQPNASQAVDVNNAQDIAPSVKGFSHYFVSI